jgi:malonyl-ACP decarboxylase
MGRFALLAAREAAARGRLGEAGAASGDRLGLYFGYGGLRAHWNDMMPALARQEDAGSAGSWQRGLRLLHPFWMLQHLSNNAHALAAQELGARGDGLTVAGANAGAQALEAAVAALQAGAVDAALVVAYDTLVEPETLVELAARGGFTGGGVPAAPYDRAAAGFVPGEAAAAVLLERPADAGARALALVDAWSGADGAPTEPAGATLARLLALLPGDAGLSIGVVDGAARATPARDAEERAALATRPDLVSLETPICATLGAMGQLGAAAAVVQAITLGASLRAGRLAPVAALESPAPGPLCPLRPHAAPEAAVRPAHPVGLGLSTGAPGLVGLVRVALP